jgi:hypothetical protein
MLLAFGGVALLGTGLAAHWTKLNTVCRPASSCLQYQVDAASAHTLSQHGITVVEYGIYTAAVLVAASLVWYGLAVLIVWRKPNDRGALVAAFLLVLFPQFVFGTFTPFWPGQNIGFAALILFGLLFPSGRFAPRWTRWLAAVGVLSLAALRVPAVLASGAFWLIPIVLVPICVIGVQVYRFRRVSSWAERQRTKWAFLGLLAGIVSLVAMFVGSVFATGPGGKGMDSGGLYGVFVTTGLAVAPLVIPISIAIALLRSGLWDVDPVISRALAWAALTLVLAGVYIGGVIGLQAVFGRIAGNGSAPAIAVSTLAIVALFGPLRRRLQSLIDRRFYRSRYDAARTVAAFGERPRDEVDLSHVSHGLTSVVQDTLHPEHVSLWLRLSASDKVSVTTLGQAHPQ